MQKGICVTCGGPLSRSLYSKARDLKSCPSCSQFNGREHIFRAYPTAFGRSSERATEGHPDGAQSHCLECRNELEKSPDLVLCRSVVKES